MTRVSFSLSSSNKNTTTLNKPPPPLFQPDNETPSQQPDPAQSQTLIIPPIPNKWKPNKNPQIPPIETLKLETETDPDPQNPSSLLYGLNLRNIKENDDEGVAVYEPIERLIAKKLKEDLGDLPDDRGLEEFDGVPVEGYGVALLKGYGWYEGRGIGKRHEKNDVRVFEFARRNGMQGLGFVGADPVRSKFV